MNFKSTWIHVVLGAAWAIGWTGAPMAEAGETRSRAEVAPEAGVTTPAPPPGSAPAGVPDASRPAMRNTTPPTAAPLPSRPAPGMARPTTPVLPAGAPGDAARTSVPAMPAAPAARSTEPLAPLPPGRLARPAPSGKPDYAISLDSQQEYNNTSLSWTFRVVNSGKATPEGKTTSFNPMKAQTSAAKLVISVGKPCPKPTSWQAIDSMALPTLEPGASVVVPQGRYKMPDTYAGKGCRFRAAIVGPDGDANTANNDMEMITKTALMPDLVLGLGAAQINASGGVLEIRNAGTAPAGPSKAVFQCQTNDKNISCGHISDPWKPEVVIEYPVPELKPGQTHSLKGLTPKASTEAFKSVSWKATADVYYEVAESNEGNNTLTGPKK